MAKHHSTRSDIYQEVTNTIIQQLEAGTAPWIKPWTGADNGLVPYNASTDTPYRGINVLMLWSAAVVRGFESDAWVTYKQAQAKGWQVRKGAKSARIVKVGQFEKDNANGETQSLSFMRYYSVFNVAEIDGYVAPPAIELPEVERDRNAEEFIAQTGADVTERGGRACYIPSADTISLPPINTFTSAEHFYATALHELTHWTGNEKRLDRDLRGRFGDNSYAAEELIAEIGAAFLCASLQIPGELQHANYIDHWLDVLRGDKKAVFTAASKAQQASEYLQSLQSIRAAA